MSCSMIHFQASPGPQWRNNPPAHVEVGSTPESGRSPGSGNGNPIQCSCLGNPQTEEPRGLQFEGSQWLERDWACTADPPLTSGSRLLIYCLVCSVSTGHVVLCFPSRMIICSRNFSLVVPAVWIKCCGLYCHCPSPFHKVSDHISAVSMCLPQSPCHHVEIESISFTLHLLTLLNFYSNYPSISGVGIGNPLQYSCLENSMDRGHTNDGEFPSQDLWKAWTKTIWEVRKHHGLKWFTVGFPKFL